jgi:hypothetical protein
MHLSLILNIFPLIFSFAFWMLLILIKGFLICYRKNNLFQFTQNYYFIVL